jgi:hypothetical protein
VQSLAAAAVGSDHEPYDRDLYTSRRADAARLPPDPAEVAALRELAEPFARTLGGWELAEYVFEGRHEAERQLELGPHEALRALAVRSLASFA